MPSAIDGALLGCGAAIERAAQAAALLGRSSRGNEMSCGGCPKLRSSFRFLVIDVSSRCVLTEHADWTSSCVSGVERIRCVGQDQGRAVGVVAHDRLGIDAVGPGAFAHGSEIVQERELRQSTFAQGSPFDWAAESRSSLGIVRSTVETRSPEVVSAPVTGSLPASAS